MNRIIKFRAWDKKGKNWLKAYEAGDLGILSKFMIQLKYKSPKDLILMQFTGLYDKNGIEIYEGDKYIRNEGLPLVGKIPNNKIIIPAKSGTVIFHEGAFKLKGRGGSRIIFNSLIIRMFGIEITGNIYEHPERT